MRTGRAIRDARALEAAGARLCSCGHRVDAHREKGYTWRVVDGVACEEKHPDHAPGVFYCTVAECDCARRESSHA